ncbi:Cytidine/deoxycytidylate deaminase family protein [candidate division SR1 bacterium RAAC1_SR1_1]|nr:Cytidine/deoxycytidylate deaminase family protein [candidate division SR1 bacterium RAAC1_SR1_1]
MNQEFMREAVALSLKNMESNAGGPFGAVIVKNGEIVGRGRNKVTSTNDPTAHAEMTAIRDACQNLKTFQLDGCELYTSCEPCPMCLGAIYWARFDKVYYGNTKEDAAHINFDDQYIYEELDRPLEKRHLPMQQLLRDEAIKVFQKWAEKQDKILY